MDFLDLNRQYSGRTRLRAGNVYMWWHMLGGNLPVARYSARPNER
jgi:hypothetical protein